jgi:hypothetical protein
LPVLASTIFHPFSAPCCRAPAFSLSVFFLQGSFFVGFNGATTGNRMISNPENSWGTHGISCKNNETCHNDQQFARGWSRAVIVLISFSFGGQYARRIARTGN